MQIIHQTESDGQTIIVAEVNELFGEKGCFRVLQFENEAAQGAIDINSPERILFEYPRAMIHLMESNDETYEHVFMIGHGIGTLPRALPGKRFTIAEINRDIAEISQNYFGYPDEDILVGDGRMLLDQEPDETYQYIIVDAFTEQGTPEHLSSVEFFKLAADKLDSRGSVLLNLIGRRGHDYGLNSIFTSLRQVFPYTKAFTLPEGGFGTLNNLLLAGSKKPVRYQERKLAGFQETILDDGDLIYDAESITSRKDKSTATEAAP